MPATQKLLAVALGASALSLGVAGSAQATPYAFASNQITGLTIVGIDGTGATIPLSPTNALNNASDSAQFTGFAPSAFQNSAAPGTALNVTQAVAGTTTAGENTFTPVGPGGLTGTRSDATISAGTATSGGVNVSNVAEGNGNALGNANGNNSTTATFQAQVLGTGEAVRLSFTDLINLIASTSGLAQETATASITNTFSITPQGSGTPIYSVSPADLNRQLSSQNGVPPTNSFTNSFLETLTSPVLTAGVLYNISGSTASTINIQPGTPAVPEPASLAVLGAGLFGLGFLRRRRQG